jgi:uncharacterized protein YbjT (DUF2867 family)
MRIAVAGATGRVGRHVMDLLKAGGNDVVSIARSTGLCRDDTLNLESRQKG